MTNRKYYLDNLRAITLMMLFPYHTFMIYNNWGENFYIEGAPMSLPSLFIQISAVWMMPLLFAVAGMSTVYALEKRSPRVYIRERVSKLLIPLLFGLLLIVPIQSYLSDLFHTGTGNYLNYFIQYTDLRGTDGGFTTGQLWFILYLFLISVISIPLIVLDKKKSLRESASKIPLVMLIALGAIPVLVHPLLNFGGKSFCEDWAYFLLGYFFLSNDRILQILEKYRFLMLGISVAVTSSSLYFNYTLFEMASWLSILAILGLAVHYMNFSNTTVDYLSKFSFGIFIFHQSWIIIAAFFIFKITENPIVQIPLILISAIVFTCITYEGCKQIRFLRWMFGIKL